MWLLCVTPPQISFKKGSPQWSFDADDLIQGETDGSSFNNGGMRATHTAGAYLKIDPESPIFLRGDAIYSELIHLRSQPFRAIPHPTPLAVPAVMVAWNGHSLDEKTPLHRAVQTMSKEGKRCVTPASS